MATAPNIYEQGGLAASELLEVPQAGDFTDEELAHSVGLGGLYTSHQELWLYDPILQHESSPLPTKHRFLPPLGKGLVSFEEMIGQMEEDIDLKVEQLEGPVAVAAHSLGLHLAMAVALKRPELFRSIMGLGGVGCGIESLTPAGHIVRAILRRAEGVEDIMRGSDYMQEHERRVRTEWPEDIPVVLVATPYDELARFSDTLDIELPPGQRVEKRVIAPDIPGMNWFLRNVMGMPKDATILHSKLPALHEFLPRHHVAIEQDRQVRSGSVEHHAASMMVSAASAPRRLITAVT